MKDFNNPSLHPEREKMNKFRLSFLVLILPDHLASGGHKIGDSVWVSP